MPDTSSSAEGDFPRFSPDELTARRRAMFEVMDQAGVDQMIAYGANRVGSSVQWLSEWPVTLEAALVLSPSKPDHLFVQHYNHVPNARRIASQCEVAWGGESTSESIARHIAQAGSGRIGVVGPIPHRTFSELSGQLGELVSLDSAYTKLRLIKSPEEIARTRVATAMTDRAVAALVSEVKPGLDERHLGAIVESTYLGEGGTNQIHYFATTPMDSPTMCVPAQYPSTRRIEQGDVLFCEISAAYWGYSGQLLRTFTIGSDPTPLFNELHETADLAFDAIVEAVKPGATAADLVAASKIIEDRGYTIYDDLVHGYVGGYLPPVLGSASRLNRPIPDLELQPGMALVVQPNVITKDESAGVQTGQLMVVTENGSESLHAFPRGMTTIRNRS